MENQLQYIHDIKIHNMHAPNEVVPLLLRLFNPTSVLDVGCGIGTWLQTFQEHGVSDILGLDGAYVDKDLLTQHIPFEQFVAIDLSQPFNLKRKFDIVISLEVAEHLPESSAQTFIESLARHSDIIVFSAAIPWQGGQNHVNEQWKDYWIKLFNGLNYNAYDLIRPLIWNNNKVEWWYKQNIIVFSKFDLSHLSNNKESILEMVHPDLFIEKLKNYQIYVNELEEKLWTLTS